MSTSVNLTPSAVDFTPTTGLMKMTLGNNWLKGPETHHNTSAAYNPTTGIMTLTIANHGFSNGDRVMIAKNSINFNCTLDGGFSEHRYPRVGDPAATQWLDVTNVTKDTFDVQVLNSVPSTNQSAHTFIPETGITPTGATFDTATGVMTITSGTHYLSDGDYIKISDNAVVFRCDQDGQASDHAYPRSTDPVSGKWIQVFNCTNTNFSIQVLENVPCTNTTTHVFQSAVANSIHRGNIIKGGDAVKVQTNSLTFTCAQDDHATNHTYPRASGSNYTLNSGADPVYNKPTPVHSVGTSLHTVTTAAYNPQLGIMTLTVPNHGFTAPSTMTATDGSYDVTTSVMTLFVQGHGLHDGDKIMLTDGAVTWRCEKDDNSTTHTYPRSTDPISGKWVTVHNVTGDYFDITTGRFFGHNAITNDTVHTFSSGSQGGIWKANDKIKMDPESVTFTCAKDGNATNHAYPRMSDPSHHEWLPISNVNQNTFDVHVGKSQDTSTHTFVSAKSSGVERPDGTVTLMVGISSNTTEHTFIDAATGCIQTGGNHVHSFVAANALTPTNAGYNPTTGIMTLTINGHGLLEGDRVKLDDDAVTFRCDQDGQSSDHAYPRNTDPVSGQWIPIENVTTNTFDVKVLFDVPSTNVTTHVFQSAAASSVHTYAVWRDGDSIRIDDDSLIFTCEQDGHGSNHTYPRASGSNYSGDLAITAGADPYYQNSIKVEDVTRERKTATNVVYVPTTGVMTITLGASHGVSNGDRIKIAPHSITLQCDKDNNATDHTYPRVTDPMFDQWLTVSNSQATTIDVNVGISGVNDVYNHTFVSATANGIHHQTGKIRVNVGKSSNQTQHIFVGTAGLTPVIAGGNYAHAFVSANSGAIHTGGDYNHKFVSATHLTPTDAAYNPSTGVMTITSADHGIHIGNYVKLHEGAVTFTCQQDSGASYHSYPRKTDPANDRWLKVLARTNDTFDVKVLNNTPSTNTTAHTFKSAATNSVLLATFMKANDTVSLATDGLTFTCSMDGNATEHTYPRVTDPAYKESLKIISNGVTHHTPTGASYTPSNGNLDLTITGHNFSAGDKIMIEDDSILFTCTMDGNSSAKAYPRGSDPVSRQWRELSVVDANTIRINVGTTANTTKNVNDADYDPNTGKLKLNIGAHNLKSGQNIKLADGSLTFTCAQDSFGSNHTYPRTTIDTHTATNASYNGDTGYLTLTVAGHGLDDGSLIKIDDNGLTFRCDFDGNTSDHTYPRSSDPVSGKWLKLKNVTTDTFDVNVGKTPFVGYDPQDVDYNPSTGVMKVITGPHNVEVGEKIWIAKEGFVFTCAQDNHQTLHAYPRTSDPAYNTPVTVTAVEQGSISFNILSSAPSTNTTAHTFVKHAGVTPTAISYNGTTGFMTVTVENHGMANGEAIKFEDYSLVFTCNKDSHATEHVYPRPTDYSSGTWLTIDNVTTDTFRVKVLDKTPSTNTSAHTFIRAHKGAIKRAAFKSGGAYTHAFQSAVGSSIKQKRDRAYDHSIVIENTGDAKYTATAASFVATTGVLTLTVANNPFSNGDMIKLADNSIIFTCDMDGHATQHSYPRSTDPASNKYLEISNVSGNNFDVNVGATPLAPYNVSDAQYEPTTGLMTLDIGPHPFRSATAHTITGATYDAVTGMMTVTVPDHGFVIGDRVHFTPDSISFNCGMDGNISNKTYPRPSDPLADLWVDVENITTNTFDVYVGNSPQETFSVTNATYSPTSGDLVLTIGDHHLQVNESVKLVADSLVFTCDYNGDGNTTQKTYPRAAGSAATGTGGSDYVYDTAITITAVTGTTITLNVNGGQGAITDTTAHNFVLTASAQNCVISGGQHTHAFSSAVANGLHRATSSVKLVDDGLSFKCAQDNFSTTHTYPRAAGVTQSTVTGAEYNPNTGRLRLTVASHGYNENDWIKIADNSLTFRCMQDSNGSDHTYPRSTDPVSGKWIQIRDVTTNTFDVVVLDTIPSTNVTAHTFQTASANGITHKKDPYYDTALPIHSVTGHTITINIGKSSNTSVHNWAGGTSVGAVSGGGQYTHTFVSAVTDGIHWKDSEITIDVGAATYLGEHRFVSATSGAVKVGGDFTHTFDSAIAGCVHRQNGWITLDVGVAAANNQYAHTFVSAIPGVLIGGGNYDHKFVSATSNGIEKANTYVWLEDGAIHMTCDRDDNESIHAYPRATDPGSDEWLAVNNCTATTFDLFMGKSPDKSDHTFVAAKTGGVKKQTGTITINVGIGGVGDRYAHTFVSAINGAVIKGGDYRHTWVSGASNAITVVDSGVQLTPTDGYYNPVTGDLTLTVVGHTLTQNDNITLAPRSIVFTCTSDQNATNHYYPRATDYADDRVLPITAVNSWAYPVSTKLEYWRGRLVDYNYTGTESSNVETEIASLIQFVTDGIQNPGIVNGRAYQMPICWPIKYTPDVVVRDLSVTWDANNGGSGQVGNWNQTCPESASALSTLTDIFINTIREAAENNVNYLTASVTKTFPYNGNTVYQAGTCYDCTSATETLFDIMTHTLGAGMVNQKRVANVLLFNTQSISQRAFTETQQQYPTTNLTIDFALDVLKAVRYDLVTGGNAGAFKLSQGWFDGEGTFIAFPTTTRSHILYCLTRIREYIKSVMYLHTSDAVWANYDVYIPTDRFEWNQEAVEFMVDSSLNPIEFALERSTFATEARIQFISSTDVVNLSNKYEVGKDWNTDPALVLLTPEVEVGFERAEYRVRINRANNFRRGDILSYIPASQTSLQGLATQPYFYCLTATAEWFEIGVSPIHDGRFRTFQLDTSNSGAQIFAVERRSGINRTAPTYPSDPSVTPIQGGFNPADVIFGGTSDASAEISAITMNAANIRQIFTHFVTSNQSQNNSVYQTFTNGEEVVVQGAVTNKGFVLQAGAVSETGTSFLKIHTISGAINQNDVLEGTTSGTTATVDSSSDRFFTNLKMGSFNQGDWFFDRDSSVEGYISEFANKSGSLTGNTGGRITIDVETIKDPWVPGDVIYGSVTSYILDVKGISGTQIQLNQFVHGRAVYELNLGTAIIDTGVNDTFNVGDEVILLQGTTEKNPGFHATVTKYTNDPDNGIHKLWIGNLVPVGIGAPISEITDPNNNIGKLVVGSNFPSIYAGVSSYTTTDFSSYAKVVAIEQQGITATIWVEDAVGEFVDNMSIISDDGWGGAVSSARTLEGRVNRYFRGFDGVQTTFDLTVANGEAYFPDPAGHLLAFVNGILQPPGATNAYVAFSDKIQFTEPPVIGSQYIGYYVGKLRQLDDISFEFDSLRSSFNLKRQGLFYSLTLTEGVSSNVIRPENNIIVSLNGIIQEPGIAYEIVGSRIIFAEVPRFGATFVGFSYIGSDADVIAATVVPPIEAGDNLDIEGEEFSREVALIESSNSLITFEYTGSVKGRNAAALANITSGQLTNAVLTNPGDGYTSRPNVDVISSSGFDARLKALMGVSRVDVKTAGTGYQSPVVAVDNEVPDDWTPPTGSPINGGFDVLAGEGPEGQEGGGVTPGTIAIVTDPVNVTVNQGQTAAFTVVSTVTNDETMNYQWQKKEYGTQTWSNIIGANQATYNTGNTAQNDDGDEYRVAITASGATPVYSLSAVLTVQTGATVISNFSPTQIFDDI